MQPHYAQSYKCKQSGTRVCGVRATEGRICFLMDVVRGGFVIHVLTVVLDLISLCNVQGLLEGHLESDAMGHFLWGSW